MIETREAILKKMFEEVNEQMFEGRLSRIVVAFSERMTTAAGRYFPQKKLIRLSAPYLRLHGWEKCRATLIHEMIHADLHTSGEPYGHTPAFKRRLEKLTGEKSIYHYDDMRPYDRPYRHVYVCPSGHKHYRKNRTRRKMSCGRCEDRFNPRYMLKYAGREEMDGQDL